MKRLLMSAGLVLVCAGSAMAVQRTASSMTNADEWKGKWIEAPWSTERDGAELDGSRPMPVFRREFVLRGRPVKAELRIAGLGQYVATVNGVEMEPKGLHQAWTAYTKTVTFDTLNVTERLVRGRNVL